MRAWSMGAESLRVRNKDAESLGHGVWGSGIIERTEYGVGMRMGAWEID